MLRLAFDFIITWRETRTRPNAYTMTVFGLFSIGMNFLQRISTKPLRWDKKIALR